MKSLSFPRLKKGRKSILLVAFLISFLMSSEIFAHCDSYDGPVIQDAYIAFETKNVVPVLKWIESKYEEEISTLFLKTLEYRDKDQQVYELLERHFLETLVRYHREGEGAPYTGLKPAGSTSTIIKMTDASIENKAIEPLLRNLNSHIGKLITEKHERLMLLNVHKEESIKQGRDYVAAYVDYTHTVEALHKVLEHASGSNNSTGNKHDHNF